MKLKARQIIPGWPRGRSTLPATGVQYRCYWALFDRPEWSNLSINYGELSAAIDKLVREHADLIGTKNHNFVTWCKDYEAQTEAYHQSQAEMLNRYVSIYRQPKGIYFDAKMDLVPLTEKGQQPVDSTIYREKWSKGDIFRERYSVKRVE